MVRSNPVVVENGLSWRKKGKRSERERVLSKKYTSGRQP